MFRDKRQKGIVIALFVVVMLVAALVPAVYLLSGPSDGDVVATYAGGVVTRAEFEKQFAFQRKLLLPSLEETTESREAFLQEYVALHKLMIEAAKKEGVTVDESNMDSQVAEYKQQVADLIYGGDGQLFAQKLAEYGIVDEDIRVWVRHDQYLRRYRELAVSHLTVTDDEAKMFYEGNKARFMTGTVAQLFTKTEMEAVKVQERLFAKEDFAKIAKEVSLDPTAAQTGGLMAGIDFDLLEPELRQAAAAQELGAYSSPLKTSYGWHILRVDKRDVKPFEQVKEDARQKLLQEKQDKAWEDLYLMHVKEGNVQVEDL